MTRAKLQNGTNRSKRDAWVWRVCSFSAALLVIGSSLTLADDVHLENGSSFEDVVVTRTDSHVIVELPAGGRLRLPNEQVREVVLGSSPLQRFREYREELLASPGSSGEDVLDLVRWAQLNGLEQEARSLALVLARAQPDLVGLAPVMSGIGYQQDEHGVWILHDDLMRRRGMVRYADRWMSPSERDAQIDRERAAEVRASYERRNDRAQSSTNAPSASPSDNEVALESIRLARSVVEQQGGDRHGHHAPPITAAVIGGVALRGGHTGAGGEAYQAYRAQIRADIAALAKRQPGSILPLSTFRAPVNDD